MYRNNRIEYFMLEVNKNYIAPAILGCDAIRPKNMKHEADFYQLPNNLLYHVQGHMQMVPTDIITYPNFFVSLKAKEIIEIFQPPMQFKRIVLYDAVKERSFCYYLPCLERVSCLTKNSSLNQDRSVLYHGEIEGNKVRDRVLFRVLEVNSNCVMIRLDLVESLLRRGMIGIGLREVDIVYEESSGT